MEVPVLKDREKKERIGMVGWDLLNQGRELFPGKGCVMGDGELAGGSWTMCVLITLLILEKMGKIACRVRK